MENLFVSESKKLAPLADRMRRKNLDEFLGQEHIASKNSFLVGRVSAFVRILPFGDFDIYDYE